eukprot:2676444-Amphidinium_carterae.1
MNPKTTLVQEPKYLRKSPINKSREYFIQVLRGALGRLREERKNTRNIEAELQRKREREQALSEKIGMNLELFDPETDVDR